MDKEKLIEFYKDQIWDEDMPKAEDLTDKDKDFLYKTLKSTLWFARWMIANNFTEVRKQMQKVIQGLC